MPPAPVPVRVVSPRSLASCLHRSCLASNIPGCSRMTQARFSGPNGSALQFSANAVDENAAEKPINAKMILSIAIIGLVSISASSNEHPCPRYQTPEHTQRGIKHKSRVRGPQPQRGTSAVCPEIIPKESFSRRGDAHRRSTIEAVSQVWEFKSVVSFVKQKTSAHVHFSDIEAMTTKVCFWGQSGAVV